MYKPAFSMMAYHGYLDETVDGGGGGGAVIDEGSDLNIDIDRASDDLGASLGLDSDDDKDLGGSATPSDETKDEDKVDKGGAPSKTDAAANAGAEAAARAAAAAKAAETLKADRAFLKDKVADPENIDKLPAEKISKMAADYRAKFGEGPIAFPKAWKQEMQTEWDKLPPNVKAYISQREEQAVAGLGQYTEAAKGYKQVLDIIQPYRPLLDAQGIKDPNAAIRFLMIAHANLSNGNPDAQLQYAAHLMRSYKVDPDKLVAALKTETPYASETEKKLAQRVDNLEGALSEREMADLRQRAGKISSEVEAFASDPKHPYFDECARHIALLLKDPNVSLADAYEMAVYANPVTREKELGRLRTEAEAAARKTADEAAAAAKKSRGTKIEGRQKERPTADFLGSIDDTLHETYKSIQDRQE